MSECNIGNIQSISREGKCVMKSINEDAHLFLDSLRGYTFKVSLYKNVFCVIMLYLIFTLNLSR